MCYRKLGELKKRFSVKALLYYINKYVNLYSFCLINRRAAIAGAIIGLLLVFVNSRTAIADAIIGLHLVFYN